VLDQGGFSFNVLDHMYLECIKNPGVLFLICIFCLSCQSEERDTTRVVMYVKSIGLTPFYAEQLRYAAEKPLTVDSAMKNRFSDTLVFYLPRKEPGLFEIWTAREKMKITLINDSPEIIIEANYVRNLWSVKGSAATMNYKRFEDAQMSLHKTILHLEDSIHSPDSKALPASVFERLSSALEQKKIELRENYKSYADTVSSPAAFLKVYDRVEFDQDFPALRSFVNRAAQRFPGYSPVQELRNDVMDYISIFEEEFVIGDSLPDLILPDQYGKLFSTHSITNKIVLIDFWSTFCHSCYPYMVAKTKARRLFPSDRFEIISIALDPDTRAWQDVVRRNQWPWPQLVDAAMWKGPAAKTLKFDSIPFNFLLSPQGRIIRKAIKPDSLTAAIQRALDAYSKPEGQ
jgi:hypothetical protein